jgi:hypothetical protein
MSAPPRRIVPDIPSEWRAEVESIEIPDRDFPPLPDSSPSFDSLSTILTSDRNLHSVPMALDSTAILLKEAADVQREIERCRTVVENAELKRREIASNAELIHGECDSQIAAEQRLSVFVKSIDSNLRYFDDLERMSVDFMSPLFTVLSPDFSLNLTKIEKGIQFFEMNSSFRDSKVYLLRYQSLQMKAVELIKAYISSTFSGLAQRLALASRWADESSESNVYGKFTAVAPAVRRLLRLAEKTPAFCDIVQLYRSARMSLISPMLSAPLASVSDLRSKASVVLTFVRKEYELAKDFFNFQGHPGYSRCFSELVHDIGQTFYDSCCPFFLRTLEIKQLCDACVVLKGDVLQEEIDRLPLAAEKLRSHVVRLLSSVQERLLFRIEVLSKEISASSERTIEVISLLFYALPSDSFGEVSCTLLTGCLDSLQIAAKKFAGLDRDIFLLSHYLALRERMRNLNGQMVGTSQSLDFEPLTDFLWRLLRFDRSIYHLGGERGFVRTIAGISRVVSVSIDGKKKLESATSLSFQSLTSYATQLLAQPLLNLKARQVKDKAQILAAVEGVTTAITEHFKSDIGAAVRKHIENETHIAAVLDVLHRHFHQVIDDCFQAFAPIDDETQAAEAELKKTVSALSF